VTGVCLFVAHQIGEVFLAVSGANPASPPELIDNPLSKAEAEARSQFDLGIDLVEKALRRGSEFRWRPSMIQALTERPCKE
jgi:hypothetical protein